MSNCNVLNPEILNPWGNDIDTAVNVCAINNEEFNNEPSNSFPTEDIANVPEDGSTGIGNIDVIGSESRDTDGKQQQVNFVESVVSESRDKNFGHRNYHQHPKDKCVEDIINGDFSTLSSYAIIQDECSLIAWIQVLIEGGRAEVLTHLAQPATCGQGRAEVLGCNHPSGALAPTHLAQPATCGQGRAEVSECNHPSGANAPRCNHLDGANAPGENLDSEKITDIITFLKWLSNASELLASRINQPKIINNKHIISRSKPSIVRSSYNFCPKYTQCKNFYNKNETPTCKEHHYVHSILKYDIDSVVNFLQYNIDNNLGLEGDDFNNFYSSIKTICFVTRHMAKEIDYIHYITKNNSELFHKNNPIDNFRKNYIKTTVSSGNSRVRETRESAHIVGIVGSTISGDCRSRAPDNLRIFQSTSGSGISGDYRSRAPDNLRIFQSTSGSGISGNSRVRETRESARVVDHQCTQQSQNPQNLPRQSQWDDSPHTSYIPSDLHQRTNNPEVSEQLSERSDTADYSTPMFQTKKSHNTHNTHNTHNSLRQAPRHFSSKLRGSNLLATSEQGSLFVRNPNRSNPLEIGIESFDLKTNRYAILEHMV